jgi:hypothetical protein
MSCNCKKNTQVLNNLDSQDHLNMAFDVYKTYIKGKPEGFTYDEGDKKIFVDTFLSLYPNVKMKISYEHALETIKNINKQYGK